MKKVSIAIRTISIFLILITAIIFPSPIIAAEAPIPEVDIWTSKGGKGLNAHGGTFGVGEEKIFYVMLNTNCQANFIIFGPSGNKVVEENKLLNGPATYEFRLGKAENKDLGEWQVNFYAFVGNYYAADIMKFIVAPASSTPVPLPPTPSTPPTSPTPPPSQSTTPPSTSTPTPSSPPQQGSKILAKVSPDNSNEFLALLALRMTEGLLTGDPNLDANKDGKVTMDDVNQILQWSVDKGTGGISQQPSGTTPQQPAGATLPQPPGTTGTTGASPATTSNANRQVLVGKWTMNRLSLDAPFPKEVPKMLIDMLIPKNATWETSRNPDQLTIKYDGGISWYKEPFFMSNSFTEGTTSVQEKSDGLSCTFQTPVTFYIKSVPFGDIEQIRGSFTSTVTISASGNNLDAVCTITNVKGSYQSKEKDGSVKTNSINFAGIKATYAGVRK